MDKMDEIEKQLNNMFQFMFKEEKRYVFIENDVKGFIDINVADEKAYDFIIQDKQRFLSLVNDYLDVNDVRIRKFKGTLPDIIERPQLLKQEVIVTKYVKQKIFVVKKKTLTKVIKEVEVNDEIRKVVDELKEKLFQMRDEAWDRHKKNPSKHQDYFLYGTYLTVAEAHHYIKQMEDIFSFGNSNSKELIDVKIKTINQIEKFIFNEFEKIWDEQKEILRKHINPVEEGNVVFFANAGEINFLSKLLLYFKTLRKDHDY